MSTSSASIARSVSSRKALIIEIDLTEYSIRDHLIFSQCDVIGIVSNNSFI